MYMAQNQLTLMRKIRLTLIQLLKGGDKMKKARDIMVETMEDLRAGKCPQDVADLTHKLGHSTAQNQFAEAKEFKAMGDLEISESLKRTQESMDRM